MNPSNRQRNERNDQKRADKPEWTSIFADDLGTAKATRPTLPPTRQRHILQARKPTSVKKEKEERAAVKKETIKQSTEVMGKPPGDFSNQHHYDPHHPHLGPDRKTAIPKSNQQSTPTTNNDTWSSKYRMGSASIVEDLRQQQTPIKLERHPRINMHDTAKLEEPELQKKFLEDCKRRMRENADGAHFLKMFNLVENSNGGRVHLDTSHQSDHVKPDPDAPERDEMEVERARTTKKIRTSTHMKSEPELDMRHGPVGTGKPIASAPQGNHIYKSYFNYDDEDYSATEEQDAALIGKLSRYMQPIAPTPNENKFKPKPKVSNNGTVVDDRCQYFKWSCSSMFRHSGLINATFCDVYTRTADPSLTYSAKRPMIGQKCRLSYELSTNMTKEYFLLADQTSINLETGKKEAFGTIVIGHLQIFGIQKEHIAYLLASGHDIECTIHSHLAHMPLLKHAVYFSVFYSADPCRRQLNTIKNAPAVESRIRRYQTDTQKLNAGHLTVANFNGISTGRVSNSTA
ncbi:hypothetical protein BJ508DRAFT_302423 [Ascobolus immersus RN42]|uniref:Uncharacterized protein n=1 Tax=Ascobolus immersus RN42 TaxID=1160509 RepID=A0A3N4IKV9_ASCIM|nr:hypothetical protein BJ508DRAFT_302423 [Ascobolus immersus RN42]